MSLTSSLQRIVSAKESIRQAIESKGVTVASSVGIADYPSYIGAITTGTSCVLLSKTITANGTYYASDDSADGYSEVLVSVPTGGGGSDKPFNLASYLNGTLTEINDTDGDIKELTNYPSGSTGILPPMFSKMSMLSSVYLPSCTQIGGYAFTSCSLLENISLPMAKSISTNAFQSCYSLSASLELPECEYIGYYAFSDCSSITSISIPNCSKLENGAFYHTSLSYLYAPKCEYIGTVALGYSNVFKSSLYVSEKCNIGLECGQPSKSQGAYNCWLNYFSFNDNEVFCWAGTRGNQGSSYIRLDSRCVTVARPVYLYGWNSPSVTYIDLSNVKYIPPQAFSSIYNRQYTKTVIGNEVIEIGSSCFYLSQTYGSMTTLTFPKLESLPYTLCYGSSTQRLTSLTTSYLTYIESNALYNCTAVLNVSISRTCSSIGAGAFSNCYKMKINNGERVKITGLSVLSGNYTFARCSSITNLDIPNVSGYLGATMFYYCYSLGCVRLEQASLGGGNTFAYCYRLSKLEVLNTSVPTAMNTDFTNCGLVYSASLGYFGSIYVRNSLVSDFKASTNWASMSDRIVGMYSFVVGDATYWGAVGSTYSQWCNDWFDNEDGFVLSGTSLYTSDGTQYIAGMDIESAISDGATFTLANA